jgi:uncharacterized membrane protein YbhN (UPF0104 family)
VAPRLRLVVLASGLVVSLGLTYLALRDIDFSRFWHVLTAGHPEWLAPAFGVFALAYAVRLLRWWILFAPESRPRVGPLVRALLAGEFFTSLLPVARLGDVARIVVLYRAAGTSRAETAGTIVAERTYDAGALLLLLFVAVPFAPPVTWLRAAALALAGVGLAVAAALILLNMFGSRPIGFVLRPFARLSGFSRDRTDLAAARILRGLRGCAGRALRQPRSRSARPRGCASRRRAFLRCASSTCTSALTPESSSPSQRPSHCSSPGCPPRLASSRPRRSSR